MNYYDDSTMMDITELRDDLLFDDFDDVSYTENDDLNSYFKSIDDNFFQDPF